MSTKVIFRRAEVWLPRRPQAALPRSQVVSENRKWRHTWKAGKFNKLTSVFHASVLLLIMNFVITLSK